MSVARNTTAPITNTVATPNRDRPNTMARRRSERRTRVQYHAHQIRAMDTPMQRVRGRFIIL